MIEIFNFIMFILIILMICMCYLDLRKKIEKIEFNSLIYSEYVMKELKRWYKDTYAIPRDGKKWIYCGKEKEIEGNIDHIKEVIKGTDSTI